MPPESYPSGLMIARATPLRCARRRICIQRPHVPHRRRAKMITGPAHPSEASRRQRPHSQPTACSCRRENPQAMHAIVAGAQRRCWSSHRRKTLAAALHRGQRTMNSSAKPPSHRPRSTNRFRITRRVYVCQSSRPRAIAGAHGATSGNSVRRVNGVTPDNARGFGQRRHVVAAY
jgi:hypothetical protein